MNIAHPFREGNSRATRIWLDLMRESVTDPSSLKQMLQPALAERINDRKIYMKGIDYSYYYEQEDRLDE